MTLGVTPRKDQLFSAMREPMERHTFRLKMSDQRFTKRVSGGSQALHLSIIKHPEDFDVTADVGLRIDAVENTVNAYKTSLPESLKSKTCTIGVEMGNLSDGKQRRWTVAEADDIARVSDEIIADFEFIALPYFEKFSDLENVYRVLSSNDKEGWLHSPSHGARCMRAVALGRLLGRTDLKQLISRNESFLAQKNDVELELFRRLAADVAA